MKGTLLNFHEVIILITVVETLFMCLALKFLPSKRAQPRNILLVFFLLIAGTLSSTLVIWSSHLQTQSIAQSSLVPAILSFCLLLEGPLLYFYLRSLSEELNFLRWVNFAHLLPAVIIAILVVVMNIRILDWLPWNWPNLSSAKFTAVHFIWAVFKCWPLIYVLACFNAEHQLRKRVYDVVSNISIWELRWADIILMGFFIHWFWSFIAYFISAYISGDLNDLFGVINNYFTVILINGLFVFALVNGRQLLMVSMISPQSQDAESEAEAVSDMDEKIKKITEAVECQKVYLNSHINLDRFAESCGLKSRDVSVILNKHYKKNFFEFINELRVEEVKNKLRDESDMTILEIAMAAGFNSHSAFQRFFKRLVGVTPSEYRRKLSTKQSQ